uniref:Uncharacterized protein n=1 Tax=Oryza brachyantha TaxID=4533 RepID=J3L831_ORYBR
MPPLFIAAGPYLSTGLVNAVRRATMWLPDDLNQSRLDSVYWTLADVNFGYFLVCATTKSHSGSQPGGGSRPLTWGRDSHSGPPGVGPPPRAPDPGKGPVDCPGSKAEARALTRAGSTASSKNMTSPLAAGAARRVSRCPPVAGDHRTVPPRPGSVSAARGTASDG